MLYLEVHWNSEKKAGCFKPKEIHNTVLIRSFFPYTYAFENHAGLSDDNISACKKKKKELSRFYLAAPGQKEAVAAQHFCKLGRLF